MKKEKAFNSATFVYFLILVFFVALRLISSFGLLKVFGEFGDYFFTIIVQIVLLFGGAMLLCPKLKKQKFADAAREYCIKKPSWPVIGLSVVLGIVVFILNIFVSSAFNGLIGLFGFERSGGEVISSYSFSTLILDVIFTALLPAICEEVAHRGMLYRSMRPYGVGKAILISSLLFGLLHLNIEQFFYATIIGVVLAFITERTNSIIPAMIIHFMNNFLSTYRIFSAVNGLPFGKVSLLISSLISSNIFVGMIITLSIVSICLVIGYFTLVALIRKRAMEEVIALKKEMEKLMVRESYLYDLETAKSEVTGEENNYQMTALKQFLAEKEEQLSPQNGHSKKYGLVFLYASIALGAVLTICTFVWGIL